MPSRLYWTRQAREDLREVLQGNYRLIYRVSEMRLEFRQSITALEYWANEAYESRGEKQKHTSKFSFSVPGTFSANLTQHPLIQS